MGARYRAYLKGHGGYEIIDEEDDGPADIDSDVLVQTGHPDAVNGKLSEREAFDIASALNERDLTYDWSE
jgi:hypothetical protein